MVKKFRGNVAAIKILKALDTESRTATPEERKILARYVGFGALKSVFDKNSKQWKAQYTELRELLNDEEYDSARASVLNAHYTSKPVVDSMFSAVRRMGFTGGRFLEPSAGSGNFFGMMPADIRKASTLHGVELDLLTSKLLKAIYPKANIAVATGFQHYQVPSGYFDIAMGNPPFGSEPIIDRERSEYSGFSIHNYFIARMIDKVRDGGIVPVIVSHNFMDAINPKTREWIAKRANLVAAARLPNTAFGGNAGTEVVTDILFFQKTTTPEKSPAWVNASDIVVPAQKGGESSTASVNVYFQRNKQNILGKESTAGSMYRANEYTVEPTGDLTKLLAEFVASLPENIYQPIERTINELDSADNTIPAGVKQGSYFVSDKGEVRQRGQDIAGSQTSTGWEPKNATALERMKGMISLRNKLRTQMRMERDPAIGVKMIESHRAALNKAYDEFFKKYGYVNSQVNSSIFMDDTEYSLLQAIEFDYDKGVSKATALRNDLEERAPSAKKADIFARRVLFPFTEQMNVSSANDALLSSLDAKGRVDLEYMERAYGKSQEEIIDELGDMLYLDPATGDHVMSDEYLSGDVKTKLAIAKKSADENHEYIRNVKALEKVVPADKLPSEIYASLGAGWIPDDTFKQFATEITGSSNIDLTYLAATAQWLGNIKDGGDVGKMSNDFGTKDLTSFDLLKLTMNGKAPEVKMKTMRDGKEVLVTDTEATEAAREKVSKIKQAWEAWVWNDGVRAEKLADLFNEKHNRTVNREYNGDHLVLHGSNPAIILRKHQKSAVWRGIQDRNLLLDHAVGAGKTFVGAAIIMEYKRLGIARKPILVVPNHLTTQWRSEFARMYPAANVLAANPDDFSKANRQRMFSKIALGEYDAVIIGHSSLTKIGLDPAIEEGIYKEQIDEIANAIEAMKNERGDRGIVRDMEKIKANLEAKVEKLRALAGVRDKVVTFDELGIDGMFIDEMHEFKNLFFTTQMQRVSGLGNPKGSGKAFDLFAKVRWLTKTYGEKVPFITATGTPVSNSLSEMFTMQRYMKYDEMKRDGLHLFDSWARMYGDVESLYEVAPSGVGYRISQRFSKFKNLPSLMAHYRTFADTVTLQDLKDQAVAEGKVFPVPKIAGGRPENIVAQRSNAQRDFFGVPQVRKDEFGNTVFAMNHATAKIEQNKDAKWILSDGHTSSSFDTKEDAELALVEKSLTPILDLDPNSLLGQFGNLAQLTRETKGKINALSLTSLASKAGLDMRIINPNAEDFAGSKINKAVDKMMGIYQKWSKDKGTQLVFSDTSIPLSARTALGKNDKRVFVRDENGLITHKKGTLNTIEGLDGFPFYLVKTKLGFDYYEPVSGVRIGGGYLDKATAKQAIASFLKSSSGTDQWYQTRDSQPAITTEEIAEYRDQKDLEVAEDGSNEVSMDDIEGISGASQFSVYDDIKAKLVARGVPENQIAFIHDYNTPAKKQALFKSVNRGDVRFLFGSTPKLGAGTNVQERLVGLHHIDAPWRPSDLEQREGRIIRQGNVLYERDPDGFEVFIGRYATEQTYDTRRWQLLEHKASGIEQLRKYSGQIEIEDVAGEAANSADMKAAASGNPLILEETKLRTEVKRLTALQKAHGDGKYAMQRKLSHERNRLETWLPSRIAAISDAMQAAKANPVPTEKGAFPLVEIGGRKITDKENAEKKIAEAVTMVRTGFAKSKDINYRGIKFTIEAGFGGALSIDSPTGTMANYGAKEAVSPSGMLTRLGNYIDSLEQRKAQVQADIEQAKKDIASIESRMDAPFEELSALSAAQQSHGIVQRKLMKSSQIDAVPVEDRAAFAAEIADRKNALVALGYETALSEMDSDTKFSKSETKANNPFTLSTLATAIDNVMGGGFAKLLEATGKFKLITSNEIDEYLGDGEKFSVASRGVSPSDYLGTNAAEAINHDIRYSKDGRILAFVVRGQTYLVADNISSTDDNVKGLLHHEIGVHALQLGRTDKEFQHILRQLEIMKKAKNPKVVAAFGRVPNDTPAHLVTEEAAGYLVENHPDLTISQRILAWFRQAVRKLGENLKGMNKARFMQWANKLTVEDIVYMASKATRSAPETLQGAKDRGTFKADTQSRFYSQLRKAMRDAPDRVFSTGKATSMWLQANAPKLGIKKDEMHWSGILDWLVLQGKATKADVLAYLDANGVQVQDVILGNGKETIDQRVEERVNNDIEELADDVRSDYWYESLREQAASEGIDLSELDRDEREELLDRVMTRQERVDFIMDEIGDDMRDEVRRQEEGNDIGQFNDAKFGTYVVPGGTDYRELLITLPAGRGVAYDMNISFKDVEKRNMFESMPGFVEYRDMVSGRNAPGSAVKATISFTKLSAVQKAALEAMAEKAGGMTSFYENDKESPVFRSPHFDQPNILAHLRFDTRTDADGKKVLFVHEIQSDWGQSGKKSGFAGKDNTWKALDGGGRVLKSGSEQEVKAWDKDNGNPAERIIQDVGSVGVPSAPFVTDTKAWVSLALKKAIAYAVENGHEVIAWATGEQNADHYDLSKKIDHIDYENKADSAYILALDDNEKSVINETIPHSKLEETLGKEIAEKIINGGKSGRLEDADLKVGGKGMKAFYDQIVPQVANDVLKKVGGGKVEFSQVSTGSNAGSQKWTVRFEDGTTHNSSWADKRIAEQIANLASGDKVVMAGVTGSKQLSFTITPAMRSKVMSEGMPLFARGLQSPNNQAYDDADTPEKRAQVKALIGKLEELYGGEDGYANLAVDANRYLRRFAGTSFGNLGQLHVIRKLKEGSEAVQRRLLGEGTSAQDGGGKRAAAFSSLETRGRIGFIEGYVTDAAIKDIPHYGDYFVMEMWPAEWDGSNGVLDAPILTVTVNPSESTNLSRENPNGEMVIYGPKYGSETYRILEAKGWATTAKGQDGKVATLPDGTPWTRLVGTGEGGTLPISQVSRLLAEVHARMRLATEADFIGINWDRATGSTGFATDGGNKDASQFLKGSGGQDVYSAISDYAFNTGKKFVGDPYGLTMDSIIRRTVNMLTSAFKHGTTRHLEPAVQQEWGKAEEGVEPLDWSGSDIDKVEALVHTFLATTQNLAPNIKEYRYDFNTERFVDAEGNEVTGIDIADAITRGSGVRANGQPRIRIGEKTARRAVFLQSLVSAARQGSGERSAILERVLRWGNDSRPENTERLFSRRVGEDVDNGNRGSEPRQLKQSKLPLQGGEAGNAASWDSPEPSRLDDFLYALQDKHIDMKRVVAAIKEAGGQLIEKFNPYLAEELFHGRASKRTHDFVNTELKPLLDDMRMRGLDVAELDQYLHARHAKEANALIAQRDPDMQDGGSGMTDAEADAYMDGLPADKKARLAAAARNKREWRSYRKH